MRPVSPSGLCPQRLTSCPPHTRLLGNKRNEGTATLYLHTPENADRVWIWILSSTATYCSLTTHQMFYVSIFNPCHTFTRYAWSSSFYSFGKLRQRVVCHWPGSESTPSKPTPSLLPTVMACACSTQRCLPVLHLTLSLWETRVTASSTLDRTGKTVKTQARQLFLRKAPRIPHFQLLRRNKETNKSALNCGPGPTASLITLLGHPSRWEVPHWWHNRAASHSKVIAEGLQYQALIDRGAGRMCSLQTVTKQPRSIHLPWPQLFSSRWEKMGL